MIATSKSIQTRCPSAFFVSHSVQSSLKFGSVHRIYHYDRYSVQDKRTACPTT